MKKLILVFSGPSGAGKSTLISYLLEQYDCAGLAVSHTTRSPREGEADGYDYHYVSHGKFLQIIASDDFIEYVECYGNYYGTSRQAIRDVLLRKDVCILDLDYAGAYKVLSRGTVDGKCVGILVLPPSLKTLRKRLYDRKSETMESLNTRINEAFKVDKIAKYDYTIVNNDLENAKKELLEYVQKYI